MSEYLVGKVIGNRYEIVEKIGTGGMATVYKAKCKILDRFVAIKILKDSLKDDAQVVKKFSTESRAAAGLSHPNIVQVYDVGKDGDIDYIVMEYVDGRTLNEYIKEKGSLDVYEAVGYAIQIGRAIECAHKNNIVHRDIKPHNVLMTKDGILKVADFGIAQAATSETMVAGTSGIGSVHYISPEQARGGFTNERSDIYSLGVVLYEMLTGKLPFNDTNPVTIAIMKLEKDPCDIRNINPDIPDNIAEIVMKAIAKDQHSRYQSVSSMIYALETVLGIQDDSSVGGDDGYETKRLSEKDTKEEYTVRKKAKHRKKQKHRQIVLGAIVLVVAVLLGVLTYCAFSGGAKEYQVPDVTNMSQEEAKAKIEAANLKIDENIEYEISESVKAGLVIRQVPGANQPVKQSTKVKLYVSTGTTEANISVPGVEGLQIAEAKHRLEEKKLTYKEIEEFKEGVEPGTVISQSPSADTKVAEGFTVTLTVCVDGGQAVVPKVTGYNEVEAKRAIEKEGLAIGTIDFRDNRAEAGTVIEQIPAAGTGVEKGSKVDVVISKGLKTKTLTITIPSDAEDTIVVKAVANGNTIYSKTHKKAEGTIDIVVEGSKPASVQVYINDVMVADKVISFD